MGYELSDGARDLTQRQNIVDVELEERVTPRFTLLIRTAKIICGTAEYLCVIRDVSAQGISVRLFHPVSHDDKITLELQPENNHPLTLVWQEPGEAGFQFVTPVDVEQMIRRSSSFPRRELRFSAELPVKLVLSGARYPAMLRNISQQGARIESADRLAIDQVLRIEARNLPEIEAKVRWRKGNHYGLVFDTTFRLHDLAEIVYLLQTRPL